MIDEPVDLGTGARFGEALGDDDPVELYEHAPCGYFSIDLHGRILKANQTLQTWLGFDTATLTAMRIHDLLTVGDRIFYETHFAPSLTLQGHVREIAVELRCANERRLPVLLNAIVVADGDGQPSSVRLAVFDARERRAYEAALLDERRRAAAAAERARTLATTLQQTLLPPSPPTIPGLEIGTAYRPAGDGSEVGGDFYDVFETATPAWGVVIGDVCGKGAGAAVLTALARYTIRADALRSPAPSAVLAQLHDAMQLQRVDGFLTAILLAVTPTDAGARVRMCIAGHQPPWVVRSDSTIEEVGRTGHLLGMLGPPSLYDTDLDLSPDEILVLATDGVVEARRDGEFFGEDRLLELLSANAGANAAELAELVASEVIEFQRGLPRDDIAVVTLGIPSPSTA